MVLFGGRDKSQDQQLASLWKWIQHLDQRLEQSEKNQAILIKNNSYFISTDKQFTDSLNALVAKDKQHDQKDAEHDKLFQALKTVPSETATATTEGVATKEPFRQP